MRKITDILYYHQLVKQCKNNMNTMQSFYGLISFDINYFYKMSSNFLDRFVGKTQAVTKKGIQQMLKGEYENGIIYTNTIKSFQSNRRSKIHNTQPHTAEESSSEKKHEYESLKLPKINTSTSSRVSSTHHMQFSHFEIQPHSQNVKSKVYYDRDTKWFIEEQYQKEKDSDRDANRSSEINDKKYQSKFSKLSLEGKENRRQSWRKGGSLMKKLGGLGANIGGQAWLASKQKYDKIIAYSQSIKKKNKIKLAKRPSGNASDADFPFFLLKQDA